MMKGNNKIRKIVIAIVITAMMVTGSFGMVGFNTTTSEAATNGIVKGPDTIGTADSFTTTLSSGEQTTIKIVDSVLTIKVGSSDYTFKIGTISATTDQAVVKEKDALLHILTLGSTKVHPGNYYVFDLYTGVQIMAYRNSANGKYCSSRNSKKYAVLGKNLINNTYFYEILTSNSTTRELLMTRAEFDKIVSGGDPSEEEVTPTKTPVPADKPTVTPEPTVAPTRTPDIEVDSHTEFNIDFWYKEYKSGKITWEQFTQMAASFGWTVDGESVTKEITDYTYDEKGRLIHEEKSIVTYTKENGTGSAKVDAENKGEVNYEQKTEGNGNVNGTVDTVKKIYINNPAVISGSSKSSKTTYHVKRRNSGHGKNKLQKVQLTRTVNGKTGVICTVYFYLKKGIVKFDGITYKKVKYAGYTSKSRQIILRTKTGKIKIVPRAKGSIGKTYKAKTLKGTWKSVREDTRALAIRVSNSKTRKVMGVKNAKPKKIK